MDKTTLSLEVRPGTRNADAVRMAQWLCEHLPPNTTWDLHLGLLPPRLDLDVPGEPHEALLALRQAVQDCPYRHFESVEEA